MLLENDLSMNKKLKLILLSYLIVFSLNILYAHSAGPHSNQICKVVFGFENNLDLYNKVHTQPGGYKTIEANNLLGYAAAVSVDFTNNKSREIDYRTKDYKNLETALLGAVKIPRPRELVIVNWNHREVCHQGFDYSYPDQDYQARWDKGRELLIDIVSYAFGKPRPINPATAEFIAMIVYYTHLIGDLEKGETDSLENIGNFSSMRYELANQISLYGGLLPNPAHVAPLVSELRKLQLPAIKPELLQAQRTAYTTKILNVLAEYVPQIISNNVDSSYVFNIDVGYQIAA